jgi:hypothetical protein
LLYCWVSTQEQATEGYSLDYRLEECLPGLGYVVAQVVRIDVDEGAAKSSVLTPGVTPIELADHEGIAEEAWFLYEPQTFGAHPAAEQQRHSPERHRGIM